MPGKSDAFELNLLKLIFNGTGITGLADNTATSPLTNLYVSLHSADPTDAGTQSSNEVTYTSYARVAVPRTTGGWTAAQVSGVTSVTPATTISFPAGTGGSGQAMFFGIGTASSGAGSLLYAGVLGTNLGAFAAATSGTITVPGHNYAMGDRCAFFSQPGSALPTGLTEGTVYYVVSSATDTITISATSGGAALTFSASGHGIAFKDVGITLGAGVTPQLSTATTVTED